jgi:hypothetical protein
MAWLKDDYREPKQESNYLNLSAEGDYTIRILSEPIMGYEYWKTIEGKKKPIRKGIDEKINSEELEVDPKSGEFKLPVFFWAMKVYSWENDRVMVWVVKQAKIRKPLEAYARNKAWGDPANYDIVVTRTGLGFNDTDYQVVANPPIAPLDKDLKAKCDAISVNLDALFSGGDPFAQSKDKDATQTVVTANDTEDRNDDSAREDMRIKDEEEIDRSDLPPDGIPF